MTPGAVRTELRHDRPAALMRTTLITGGTGKLGRRLVAHFLAAGHRVVTTGRSEESVAQLRNSLPELHAIAADFTREGVAQEILSQLNARNLQPDGLVNNARSLEFLQTDTSGIVSRRNFVGEFTVDVVAPYELTMALAQQSGSRLRRVVNVGSQYGAVASNPVLYTDHARQSPIQYSVAKAALAHLTKELAVRLSPEVAVNCIAFGGFDGRVDDAFRARYAALCPLGRMLTDDEVIGPVEFLLSEASAGMTGHTMAVDGGWTAW